MRPGRSILWIAATTTGYAVGITLGVNLVGATARPLGPALGGLAFIALFGAVIGLGVGVAQFPALPRGAVRLDRWLAGTLVGSAFGFTIAAIVGEYLGDVISPTGNIVIGGGTIEITSGAMVGLGIGVAQSRVLRRPLGLERAWIVASVIGTGLGWGAAAAVLELLEVPILKVNLIPAFGAIVGILTGLAQGVALGSRQP